MQCRSYGKSSNSILQCPITPPPQWASAVAVFARAQGLLVALQRLTETFGAIKQAALIEIGHGHGAVGGDGLVVARNGLVEHAQTFQGSTLFDQRLGVGGVEGQDMVEASQRFLGLFEAKEGLTCAGIGS